jgi:AmmeMemoRadiSam system protein B
VKFTPRKDIQLIFILFSVAGLFYMGLRLYMLNTDKKSISESKLKPQYLESYFKNPADYLDAFAKSTIIPKSGIYAAVTSHHYLARDLIAKSFAGIDPSGIENLILVGPDHFNYIRGQYEMAMTTGLEWKTPFGNMPANHLLINEILKINGVISEPNIFRSEHSIYILMPFARKIFPTARIVPIVLRLKHNPEYFYNFGKQISGLLDINRTVLIISSDFSHGLSQENARISDKKSIMYLPGKKISDINEVSNDCPACTAFLFGYLDNTPTDFILNFNRNSFDISDENPGSVTSYVGGYYTKL